MNKIIILLTILFHAACMLAQNIGIGTTSPEARLDVLGAPFSNIAAFRTNSGWGQIIAGRMDVYSDLGASEVKGFVGTSTDHDFVIRTGGDDRMFFKYSNGHVGIGTSDPQRPLTITANLNQDVLQFNRSSNNTAAWHWWMPSDNLVLTETNVADYRLTIQKGTGNVGIGYEHPAAKLHVNGSIACFDHYATSVTTGTLIVTSIPNDAPVGVSFYNNNFQNEGGPFENVTQYMDKEGRVHLSGVVKIIGSQSGSMFALPPGWRPSGDLVFTAMTAAGAITRVNITPQGYVTLQNPTSGWVSVNGISFRAMQ